MSGHEQSQGSSSITDTDDRDRDWTHPNSICVRVIDAVVETMGTDSTEIDPLYDYIDPDALNDLFKSNENGQDHREGHVEFQIEEHLIRISSDGDIEVQPVAD
jgi:hypothetical protein